MLNLIGYRRRNRRQDMLSMDFVPLFFLYPSESGHYVGFRSTGAMDKMVDLVKSAFGKHRQAAADLTYYKNQADMFF